VVNRIVWLAITSMFLVALMFAVRTVLPAKAKSDAAEAFVIVPERGLKGDKLKFSSPTKTETATTASRQTVDAVQAPKIVSRHWHDPFDPKVRPKASGR
jgi:hypothetical protein